MAPVRGGVQVAGVVVLADSPVRKVDRFGVKRLQHRNFNRAVCSQYPQPYIMDGTLIVSGKTLDVRLDSCGCGAPSRSTNSFEAMLPPVEITTRGTTNPTMEESAALQIISFPNLSTGGTAPDLNPEAATARTGSFYFFAVLRLIHDIDFERTESRKLPL